MTRGQPRVRECAEVGSCGYEGGIGAEAEAKAEDGWVERGSSTQVKSIGSVGKFHDFNFRCSNLKNDTRQQKSLN